MDESQAQPVASLWWLLGIAAFIVVVLWRVGVLSGRAFEKAPPRRGRLGLADLFVGLGLWLMGIIAAVGVMRQFILSEEMDESRRVLIAMLGSQAGQLPVLVYVLVRAATGVEGGLGGFGLGLHRLGRAALWTVGGMAAIVPLTFLASMIVVALLMWSGHEPPVIAHEALRVLAEAPAGPVRWGLIVSAVVVAPLLEELLFRGLLQTAIWQSGFVRGRWAVVLIAALLFTLIHLGGAQPHALPTLMVLAIGLGYLYERSGSLWPPIAVHCLFNAVQIAIVLTVIAPEGREPMMVAGICGG